MVLVVDVERIYGHRPRPLYEPHVITLQYYSLLRFLVQKLAMTYGSLQPCLVYEYSLQSRDMKHRMSSAKTSQLVFMARLRPQFRTPPVPNAPSSECPRASISARHRAARSVRILYPAECRAAAAVPLLELP